MSAVSSARKRISAFVESLCSELLRIAGDDAENRIGGTVLRWLPTLVGAEKCALSRPTVCGTCCADHDRRGPAGVSSRSRQDSDYRCLPFARLLGALEGIRGRAQLQRRPLRRPGRVRLLQGSGIPHRWLAHSAESSRARHQAVRTEDRGVVPAWQHQVRGIQVSLPHTLQLDSRLARRSEACAAFQCAVVSNMKVENECFI